jgi:hypothetical protein
MIEMVLKRPTTQHSLRSSILEEVEVGRREQKLFIQFWRVITMFAENILEEQQMK